MKIRQQTSTSRKKLSDVDTHFYTKYSFPYRRMQLSETEIKRIWQFNRHMENLDSVRLDKQRSIGRWSFCKCFTYNWSEKHQAEYSTNIWYIISFTIFWWRRVIFSWSIISSSSRWKNHAWKDHDRGNNITYSVDTKISF